MKVGQSVTFCKVECVLHTTVPFYSFVVVRDEQNWRFHYLWIAVIDVILNAKNVTLAEIYGQIVEVYGKGAVNEGNIKKLWPLFKEGRTNVQVEEWRA
jgi:hypothetical protein